MIGLMAGGCSSPGIKGDNKIEAKALGTIAILPFEGYKGGEFVHYLKEELIERGATIVEIEDGKVPDEVDHIASGKLIGLPSLHDGVGNTKTRLVGAFMEITSTQTGQVIARAKVENNFPGRVTKVDIHEDNFYLPDTANQLIVRLRLIRQEAD
jgi:hypothetical protein